MKEFTLYIFEYYYNLLEKRKNTVSFYSVLTDFKIIIFSIFRYHVVILKHGYIFDNFIDEIMKTIDGNNHERVLEMIKNEILKMKGDAT